MEGEELEHSLHGLWETVVIFFLLLQVLQEGLLTFLQGFQLPSQQAHLLDDLWEYSHLMLCGLMVSLDEDG